MTHLLCHVRRHDRLCTGLSVFLVSGGCGSQRRSARLFTGGKALQEARQPEVTPPAHFCQPPLQKTEVRPPEVISTAMFRVPVLSARQAATKNGQLG